NGEIDASGPGLLMSGFVSYNAGTLSHSISDIEIKNTQGDHNSVSMAGFIYKNDESGDIRRCVARATITGPFNGYHDFGYVNSLGFSFANLYIDSGYSGVQAGYFDNTEVGTSDDLIKASVLNPIGFVSPLWSFADGVITLNMNG
ncbi:MAG: hypothetical protein J5618_03180, partial [Bacilli bacterium]|nr:hypothetical protein [Bacilli bacterium]